MSTTIQSHRLSRDARHAPFELYDLAHSTHARDSYHRDNDLFDTLFPQPPPRSRLQAERLARPSLPTLKGLLQVESADSSRSTARQISSSYSIESVNSLASYPSSTSSLSLLHSLHPKKQASTDSSIDCYSPAISDVNSADTDNSVYSDRVRYQSSEIDAQDQIGPFTPITPNAPAHIWRPKELNLVRKRREFGSTEHALPSHHATSSATITGDRNALLVGLGLSDVALTSAPAASPSPASIPFDALTQASQATPLVTARSPLPGSSAAVPREMQNDLDAAAIPQSGPKKLYLASSGGPPAARRFAGRRPSEGLLEAFVSMIPTPTSEASSRSNTPQMRSAIPILPNAPTFVANRSLSPDPSSLGQMDSKAGISAEEFLAQIASTPQYQASQYLESSAAPSAYAQSSNLEEPQAFDSVVPDSDFEDPLITAVSYLAVDHSHDRVAGEPRHGNSADNSASVAALPGPSVLDRRGPGFSSKQRSRAASLSTRKAPPAPLVLSSSPASSNTGTLPGTPSGLRRRSPAATVSQKSPLSAQHSDEAAAADALSSARTPTSSTSPSGHRQQDSMTDYSEPLHTAYYEFDTDEEDRVDVKGVGDDGRPTTATPLADQPSGHGILDRVITDSPQSRSSIMSSRVHSLRSEAQDRSSASSDPGTAFEFAHLETGLAGEGLSMTTMMGFLQRQESQTAPGRSPGDDGRSTLDHQQEATRAIHTSNTSTHAQKPSPSQLVPESTPAVPSFNLSVFGPNQSTSAHLVDDKDPLKAQGASVPLSLDVRTTRPRKQSIVPDTPTFAIRDTAWGERQRSEPSKLFPAVPDTFEARPVVMTRVDSNGMGSSSRWSSGSESDGESAMSIKGGRKSFSRGRKSLAGSRKNSVAALREASEMSPESGSKQVRRSSKSRASGQTDAAAQVLSVPSKPAVPSLSKRLLLNGLPNLRKKSFPNLSAQSTTPWTPSGSREPISSGPAVTDRTEFPFPPALARQPSGTPPLTNMSRQSSNRTDDAAGLSIRTAVANTFAQTNERSFDTPPTPISAPGYVSLYGASGPLTTQQIQAQARSNVWPDNFIGNGVSAAGMSSPFLSVAHDSFNHGFAPSRLAPTPPMSAPGFQQGWSPTPHTPPTTSSATFVGSASQDKSLPPSPGVGASSMSRNRSRTAEIAPPKNLRHLRQSSSNTNLKTMRKIVPGDVFKSHQANVVPVGSAEVASASSMSVANEEQLPTISESASQATALADELTGSIDIADSAASLPVLVDRRQAKMKKAQRIRKQHDRFPRHNSWSDFGLRWIAEQGADAFDRLAAEGLPSSAILMAAGASSHRSDRILTGGMGQGGGGHGDSDESDTDDYGSSDGGGGAGGGGGFGGAGGAGGGRRPSMGRGNADDSSDEEAEESDEDEAAEAMTDEDSEDDYGAKESSAAARDGRRGVMPAVPARGASIPTAAPEAETAPDSDSSDDRPLGQLVDDPKAVQKLLRAKERRRHFDMAAKALEGKGSSSATPSSSGHARPAVQQRGHSPADIAVVNANELSQRLNRVQQRRERAHAPNGVGVQRSQTVARPDGDRPAAAVSRSKSVRTAPAERYAHPGMRARTPSEAALRAKAMAQAGPHGPSPISPSLPHSAMMPELPSNAMATVVAAQKAMAMAQANPTPAAMAQAQALATSATAALNAATAQVKRSGASPVTATFNPTQLAGQTTTSPRMTDGVELPGARQRTDSRGQAVPFASSGGASPPTPVTAASHQPGMLQRLRSRSVSRNQVPLTINTAVAPPLPDLPRPDTASKDSQASNSPRSAHTATFAALAQAAAHHGRPSADGSTAHGDVSMHRMASAQHANVPPTSNESGSGLQVASSEPRQPHKVFILSRQRFTVVEVPVSARARDLALEVIERERLPMDDSKGGWVVFDCSAQLGIERPLREYEMITDVVNVRAHPKTDYLLIKRTELSPYLSLRSVPTSSPALAGWVYVQDRKKKWNKRWLELRDHGLYHAKNEKGKDEMSVCQISSFDVYLVDSAAVKMPKANGFALRSQDPITMFEKPDQDYVHYFSLTDPAAHRDWVRAILNARTYILRQEKAILFQVDSPPSSQEAASGGATASGGLARAMTSRRPPNSRAAEGTSETGHGSASGPSPSAPLIDSSAFAGPFAKGSLLADKAISDAKMALRGHAPGGPVTGAFNELSLMDQQALRSNEARRREEAAERQRRMKAEGQPLIDLVRK